MSFPSEEALDAWKQTTVSHAKWDDWINELEGSYAPEETVEERLAAVAKGHDARRYTMQEVRLEGTTVTLLYDTGEDGFREGAGDFAALMRCAEGHGAKGKFWFLGTAGAEGDFVYELSLDGKRSRLKELGHAANTKVYESEGYAAFNERLMELFEEGNPDFRARMQKARQGAPATKQTQSVHQKVMTALSAFPDAMLAKQARRFPGSLPDGRAEVTATQLFKAAGQVRRQLGESTNQEVCAVALWVLGELAPHVGVALALEAYEGTGSEPLRAAALRVFAHAGDEPKSVRYSQDFADRALRHVLEVFVENAPLTLLFAASDAVHTIKHPRLAEELGATVRTLAKPAHRAVTASLSPAHLLMQAIAHRGLKGLAPELGAFAASNADAQARAVAATCLLEWKDPKGLALLSKKLGEEYGIGLHAGHALLELDPDGALEFARRVAKTKGTGDDRKLHNLLRALEAGLIAKKRRSKFDADPRWIDVCLSLLGRGDHYLAYTALALFKLGPKSPKVVDRLEALLLQGGMQPVQVIEALRAQGSKRVKALVKQRLKVTKDPRERSGLEIFA